jgi:glucokinase
MNMMLAGDVGGTKTLLEVGTLHDGHWQPAFGARYAATDYPNLQSVLQCFLQNWEGKRRPRDRLTHACFGVAGPMFDNRVRMTNLAWIVDGNAISAEFNIPCVRVVNDFVAAASGVEMLQDTDLVILQTGEPVSAAPRLVIGAGTGFGVAYLIREGAGYQVIAGEGGTLRLLRRRSSSLSCGATFTCCTAALPSKMWYRAQDWFVFTNSSNARRAGGQCPPLLLLP